MTLSPNISPRLSGALSASLGGGAPVAVDDFIPPMRTGLAEAWDVRAGVTTATGGVSAFTGRSVGARTLVQGTEGARPAFTPDAGFFNDIPVIQCDGVNDWLGATGLAPMIALNDRPYLITVMRYRSDASGLNMGFALYGAAMAVWHLHQLDPGPTLYNRGWWPAQATVLTTSFSTGVVEIVETFLDASGVLRMYIDGSLVASSGTGLVSSGDVTGAYIGTNDGGGNFAAVSFAAAAAFSSVPSDADRAVNRAYYRDIYAGSGV